MRSKLRGNTGMGTEWQRRVIRYDREGPGVLGYYLDTIGLLASLCPLVPEVMQRDGTWERSDDPVLNVTLSGYRSPMFPQSELVALHTRHRESVGEAWIIWSEDIGWCVATVPNVTSTRSGDSIDFTDAYGNKRRVPKDRAWKSWSPDPYEPWLPTSPVRRALPDLRRLNAATRNQTRSAESRLVMNGLLAFEPDDGGARPLREAVQGGPAKEGIEQVLDDYVELAKESFDDDDAPSASVPFPYIGRPATYIELGRAIDGGALQVEDKALEAFARSVNFPAQLLTVGPGGANHWNEWLLQDVQHKMGLAPKLLPVCADITEFFYRPMLHQIKNRVGSWTINPDRVRVGFDMSFLTKKPDTTSQAMEAYRLGIVSREQVAEMLSIPADRMLEVPTGLGEYEHWQLATGGKGAPYAEVDADGKLIIPDMGGMAPMEPMPAEEPLPPEEPMVEAAPEESTTALQAPPAPPAQISAVTGTGSEMDALIGTLEATDVRLEATLMGMVAAIKTAIKAEVAKETIKQLPPRSPEREAMRDMSPEEVWRAATPEQRAAVDVQAVAERVVAQYEPQAQDAFATAADEATAAFEDAGLTVPEFLLAAAVAVLLTGVTAEVVGGFANAAVAPIAELGDETGDLLRGKRRRRRVTARAFASASATATVRSAMSAASGAAVNIDNQVVPSQSGMPQAQDGTPWEGATAMATGHTPAKVINAVPNVKLGYMWKHSFFGNPVEPFPPHLALDGRMFDSPAKVPGGLFPGDHPWCRCALLLRPMRVGGENG
jgi:hypothetical protein